MTTHPWKIRLTTLLLSLGGVGTVAAEEREPVPAILVAEDEPAATPIPICSVCSIVTKSKGSSAAIVTLTSAREFTGDVEVVVWLDSDERVSVWIPDVELASGDELDVEVEPGEGWSWSEAQFAWTRMHDAL